ncbi:MAG TPA: sugar phosphate isomerase/epimerase [Nitrospirota bacterium]|nr:sugar phosphate isomerase/epimerase [Nitrospirota bacterium]
MEPVHIHIPYPKLADYLPLLKQRRYDLEIYLSAAVLDQVEKRDLEELLERLDWKPQLTLHAPFMDLNPGAVDSMVRSVTQVRFRQLLNAAAIFKPRAAVFHAAYDRWRYAGRTDVWLENSVATWTQVMETAAKTGLRVAVENVFDEQPDALRLLIEKINSPDFGFCFDTGHCNLFSRVPLARWFEALGKHLIEVHLHDNDGTSDAHWAMGRGSVDFEAFFSLLHAHAPKPVYTIEAHDAADIEASLSRVKNFMAAQERASCSS